MKKTFIAAAFVILSIVAGIAVLRSQTPVTLRTSQFDNEDVKVWKTIVQPNARSRCIATSTHASSFL